MTSYYRNVEENMLTYWEPKVNSRFFHPGGVQSRIGWGPGQPDLEGGNPDHGKGIGAGWALRSLPNKAIL